LHVPVLVEEFESLLELLFREEFLCADSGHEPLVVLDLAAVVRVDLLDQLVQLVLVEIQAFHSLVSFFEFVSGEGAVAVLVDLVELVSHLLHVILRQQVLSKESQYCLLQLSTSIELVDVRESFAQVLGLFFAFLFE
jgi:hypothetical protein